MEFLSINQFETFRYNTKAPAAQYLLVHAFLLQTLTVITVHVVLIMSSALVQDVT